MNGKKISTPYIENCPVTHAMTVLGSKWKIPILWNLSIEDNLHYNELKRRNKGITNTMLTKCLRELEADKLVDRYSTGEVPPSVSYSLTPLAQTLIPTLQSLFEWGRQHMELEL
ncbi:MAG: helix-turn-helix domain-containing protein [bacterium]|nr:helix-turn-helix domain-containing protein [bacterium]